ncbi:glucagon receptor-like isoform X2 [Hyla sarda]|uniref:glucagon receptor-like isoform X2 n=1 Tax=Hyla sarda TaxID=327740 RepID=UPI0024C23488|nr:glucagon receptor-like isoform X2 [Hyla sarda]
MTWAQIWLHLHIPLYSSWMRPSPLLSFLSLCALCHSQSVAGKVLEKTIEEWMRYKEDCNRWMSSTPQPQGLHCNRTFDMYACWPDGAPGMITSVSCPYYLPWFQKVKHGQVSRRCGLDGLWVMINGTQPWRNSSQCEDEMEMTKEEVGTKDLLLSFRALYTVGYSVSLMALLSSLLILTMCRKLRCTRNYIHANLFFSFALRGISVIVRDVLQEKRWGMQIIEVSDWEILISNKAAIGCRSAQVIMQYCILANHYWFVVEAVYLYKLLIGAVFSEKNNYTLYLYLGWGTPVLFVVPWMTLKYLKENKECWALNDNMAYWWIIRIPILLASVINLVIFMRILKMILSKLRANQKGFADYKLRLAKATLTLIPLFGIHEVVFIFATDEQTSGILRYIKVFFNLFVSSFQGFLVAVLYCFANKEVKYEIQKKWQMWKMDGSSLLCLR